MPPASPSCTLVWRILSSSLVLPVSTWPRTQTMGERNFDSSPDSEREANELCKLSVEVASLGAGLAAAAGVGAEEEEEELSSELESAVGSSSEEASHSSGTSSSSFAAAAAASALASVSGKFGKS